MEGVPAPRPWRCLARSWRGLRARGKGSYDDPEIAVAIAIERADAGAALASTAVNILNAYFTPGEDDSSVTGENQLLP